jgi:hypothetical protein
MVRPSIGLISGVIGGALAGAVVSILIGGSRRTLLPSPVATAAAHETSSAPPHTGVEVDRAWEIRALEAKVAALQAAGEAPTDGGAPEAHESPNPEAAGERHEATFNAVIEAHGREPRDQTWAGQASQSLSDNFRETAKTAHFTFQGIDCRTTTCVADVTFDTYRDAKSQFPRVLHTLYNPPCAVSIYLPLAQNDTDPYPAKAILDCEEARSQ